MNDTDASPAKIVADRYRAILTTDQREFRTYRWQTRRPSEPLLG
jgi:hypothetical protein